MKYIDIMIAWFYGVLTKLGVTEHHDKWLHLALMAVWVPFVWAVSTLSWSLASAIVIIVGRELYNVGYAWVDGYMFKEALGKFSWRDILAGLFGVVVGVVIYLLINHAYILTRV